MPETTHPIITSEMLLHYGPLWCTVAPVAFSEIVVLGHACTDVGCSRVAEWMCFWPGQTRAKCTAGKNSWTRIADLMGFELRSEPLAVREWPEPDPSSARFAAMELR